MKEYTLRKIVLMNQNKNEEELDRYAILLRNTNSRDFAVVE